jgi:hypothetical protein
MPDMHVTRHRKASTPAIGVLGFAVIDHQPTGYPETIGQPSGFNAAKSARTELALFQGLDPLDYCDGVDLSRRRRRRPFPRVIMRSSNDRLGRAERDRNGHRKRLTPVAYRRHAVGLGAL